MDDAILMRVTRTGGKQLGVHFPAGFVDSLGLEKGHYLSLQRLGKDKYSLVIVRGS